MPSSSAVRAPLFPCFNASGTWIDRKIDIAQYFKSQSF